MPSFLATTEIRDASGAVVASARKHFHVLSPGQAAQEDVLRAIQDLEKADGELLAAEQEVTGA